MKIVRLQRRPDRCHIAYVSDEDYSRVRKHSWSVTSSGQYAQARVSGRVTLLHSFITGYSNWYNVHDHIDGNGLNNVRENIRFTNRGRNASHKNGVKV